MAHFNKEAVGKKRSGGNSLKMEGHQLKMECIKLIPFFQKLDNEEAEQIASLSMMQRYGRGNVVFQAGEQKDHLYLVQNGRVKITRGTEEGNEQLLQVLEAGNILGELALFFQQTHEADGKADTAANIFVISREAFLPFLRDHPEISMKLLQEVSERLHKAETFVHQLYAAQGEMQLATYLLELAEKQKSTSITLPMSKKDMASYLGLNQEQLSRQLGELQNQGWLRQQGHRHIQLLD